MGPPELSERAEWEGVPWESEEQKEKGPGGIRALRSSWEWA